MTMTEEELIGFLSDFKNRITKLEDEVKELREHKEDKVSLKEFESEILKKFKLKGINL